MLDGKTCFLRLSHQASRKWRKFFFSYEHSILVKPNIILYLVGITEIKENENKMQGSIVGGSTSHG
jgi:hypothetical protein